jgi:hypothetical protein
MCHIYLRLIDLGDFYGNMKQQILWTNQPYNYIQLLNIVLNEHKR